MYLFEAVKFSQGKLSITQSLTHSTQCIKSWNLEKILQTLVENETRKIKFYICFTVSYMGYILLLLFSEKNYGHFQFFDFHCKLHILLRLWQ
jgi:hypothetical protein